MTSRPTELGRPDQNSAKDAYREGAAGCAIVANDDNSPQSFTISLEDLISDFFEPGTTYEADYGYLGTDCGDSVIGVRSATAKVTTVGTPSFGIDFAFYRHPEIGPDKSEPIILNLRRVTEGESQE